MKIAVNTFVVIIIGLVMFAAGARLLTTIVGETRDIDIGPKECERILSSFPADEEFYIHEENIQAEESNVPIKLAVYNRFDENKTLDIDVTCASCGSGTDVDFVALDQTLEPGERRCVPSSVRNETWAGGQHVMVMNITTTTGDSLGTKTFYIES